MISDMREQTFGVELELTGLSRSAASAVLAEYFGTRTEYIGGGYDKYEVTDAHGRLWLIMRDSSILPERKGGSLRAADDSYKVEFVTPICKYPDIETVQNLIRKLRGAGAIVNTSCGIHVHIGAEEHNASTLRNLLNIISSKQDLLYMALNVDINRLGYCKKLEEGLINTVNSKKPDNLDSVADIWYEDYPSNRTAHYNNSRYHALNLHAFFTKGTVEFRCFNGTTHAGKIKAYIQFCLAVNFQALTQKSATPRKTETTNAKYTVRTWLLRLGLIGEEFKTCRYHMLSNLDGNIAWRYEA